MSSLASVPPASASASASATASLRVPASPPARTEQIKALEVAETTKLKRAEEAKAKAETLINASMERLKFIHEWYELADKVRELETQRSQELAKLAELQNEESRLLASLGEIEQARQNLMGDLALPLFPASDTPGVWGRGRYSHEELARLEIALANPATTLTVVDGTANLNGHSPSPSSSNQSKPGATEPVTPTPASFLPSDTRSTSALVEESSEDKREEEKQFSFGCNPWWQLSEVDLAAMEDSKTSHPNPFVRKWLNLAAQAVRTGDWETATNQFTRLTRGAGKDSFLAWLGHAASFPGDAPGSLREVKLALEAAYPLKDDESIDKALLSIYDFEKLPTKPAIAQPPLAAAEKVVEPLSVGNKIDNKSATPIVQAISDTADPHQGREVRDIDGSEASDADFGEGLTFQDGTTEATEEEHAGQASTSSNVTSPAKPGEVASDHADTILAEDEASVSRKAGEGNQPIANFSDYASSRTTSTTSRTKAGR